jgi:hypothetical protein
MPFVGRLGHVIELMHSARERYSALELAIHVRVDDDVTVRIRVPLVAALVLASMAACGWTGNPSAQECVDDWNARAGRLAQERVATGQFRSAMARGWLAKETYPGCGIVFITELDENQPWLACTRTFAAAVARLKEWSCEAGDQSGLDRSLGPDFHANATVISGSELVWSDPT